MKIEKKKLQIEIYGNQVDMKMPTYKDSLEYEKKLKACGEDPELKSNCLFDYLEQLGLSKEISHEMTISDVLEVLQYVSGEKKS